MFHLEVIDRDIITDDISTRIDNIKERMHVQRPIFLVYKGETLDCVAEIPAASVSRLRADAWCCVFTDLLNGSSGGSKDGRKARGKTRLWSEGSLEVALNAVRSSAQVYSH